MNRYILQGAKNPSSAAFLSLNYDLPDCRVPQKVADIIG